MPFHYIKSRREIISTQQRSTSTACSIMTRQQSRSTVAPPTFFSRNRRFRNQLPAVSPGIRCTLPPRRDPSVVLCLQETMWGLYFSYDPSPCRVAMKRSLKKLAGFWGVYRRISLAQNFTRHFITSKAFVRPTRPSFYYSLVLKHYVYVLVVK